MRIEFYLSQLLYRHQCVTIPGFGAFLTEIKSAKIDEVTHAFYPPKKMISFNHHLKNNDGLLANHISLLEGCSYIDAVSKIEQEVKLWQKDLTKKLNIELKNIGSLELNSESNIVFNPLDTFNYLTDAFGLYTFISTEVKREVYKKEVEAIEEFTPIIFTQERRSSPWLKYAAVFIVGFGLIGVIGNKWQKDNVAEKTLMVEKSVQQKVQNKIQEATFFIETPLPLVTLTINEITNKNNYHIVAGVFRNEQNAFKINEALKKLGYNSRKFPKNKYGLHPVIYQSYPSDAAAQKDLEKIKSTHNSDAWIFIQD